MSAKWTMVRRMMVRTYISGLICHTSRRRGASSMTGASPRMLASLHQHSMAHGPGGSLPWTRVPEFKEGSHGLKQSPLCSLRHDALSNPISLANHDQFSHRLRRRCIWNSNLDGRCWTHGRRWRGHGRRSKFFDQILMDWIRFVLGALRSALILCLPGCVSNFNGPACRGRRDVVEAAGRTCGLTRMKDVAPWSFVITRGGREKSRIWGRVPGPSLLGEHVTSSRGSTPDHRSGGGTARCELISVGRTQVGGHR